ncbi:hypothetical protein [Fibrella arboris]|uniref:hypothetical protein n=1 Tax=Fibrella arboris TaxID=3242486 RepID=UPI00352101B2
MAVNQLALGLVLHHRPDDFPDVFGDDTVAFHVGVNAIGLIEFRVAAYVFEQEGTSG